MFYFANQEEDITPKTDAKQMETMNQKESQKNDDDYDSSSSGDETPRTFNERLEDMPVYNTTVSNLQSMYTSLKSNNGYIGSLIGMGESVAGPILAVAKPVAMVATDVAFMVARPVIGEVKDPAASIDGCASEVLAKVQEKLPFVKQHPAQMVESATSSAITTAKDTASYCYEKMAPMGNRMVESATSSAITTAKDTASYCYEKMAELAVTQSAVQKLDNAVAFSDLAVELILPTDCSNVDDLRDLERAEEDENKGVLVHAQNVKTKACRRGRRKLLSYKHVRTTLDMVEYAQTRITETTGKLIKGSNYTATTSTQSEQSEEQCNKSLVEEIEATGAEEPYQYKKSLGMELAEEGWDMVYKSSMFVPGKALQVSGEVYVNAKDMVFKYSNVQTIKELPQAISEMAGTYYNNVNQDGVVSDVKDRAVAIVTVPAQVLSSYLQSNRFVQWILPPYLQTHKIQVIQQAQE